MFEKRGQNLIGRRKFARRVLHSALLSTAIISVSLCIGMAGYRITEGMTWLDAFLNASMILSAMGPVDPVTTTAGKVFAGCYALFSGVVFIGVATVLVAPMAHRLLHAFHLEEQAGPGRKSPRG